MRKPDGKIVLLGDMNVGKTSLLQRYMERRFPDTVSTVGGAFYLKQWRSFNISIWDTAGEGCVPGQAVFGAPRGGGVVYGQTQGLHLGLSHSLPLCSHLPCFADGEKSPVEQHSVRLREDPGYSGRDPQSVRTPPAS